MIKFVYVRIVHVDFNPNECLTKEMHRMANVSDRDNVGDRY